MPRRTEPADEIEQIFRGRNNRARKDQGAIVTQLAARKDNFSKETPTASDVTWQADLMDMTSWNQEWKFALICVDIGTRKVRAGPMRNKEPREAVRALMEIRTDADVHGQGVPKVLDTDQDKAFMGAPFQDHLSEQGIQHITKTSKFAENQLGLVDTKMRDIKSSSNESWRERRTRRRRATR